MMKVRRKSNRRRNYGGDLKGTEPIVEGVPFYVKLLGSCLVDLPNDEEHTASAVKRLVHEAKYSGIKLRKVSLTISPGGIVQADLETQEELINVPIHRLFSPPPSCRSPVVMILMIFDVENKLKLKVFLSLLPAFVSIPTHTIRAKALKYRISYCTADRHHEKVFGFIANDTRTDVLEFYAYLCSKRKIAEALTLTVAQAFHIAYEIWDEVRHDEHSLASISSEGSRDESDSPTDSQTESGESESVSSPHRKSAPQAIPGMAPVSERNEKDQGFSEGDQAFSEIGTAFSEADHIFSEGVSPLPPPPSFDRPRRTSKVLSVSSDAPRISCSAPASTVVAPPRPPRSSRYRQPPPPILVNGHHGDNGKYLGNTEDTAKLLENWHIEDPDLDDCFSKLAECRSNPQLLDINVNRTIFDTDVIVHYAGGDADRKRLLESESSDSLFLKAATPS